VVVDRYDWLLVGGNTVRIHQEDVCQALGLSPSLKYLNEGGPSLGDVVKLLRSSMPLLIADEAVWRFADALIWNWLIAGTDAHAKNYSLLLAGDQVRLAPLYDVASTLPYDTHERKLRFAMKIGGDYHVLLDRNRWPAAAKELGVDKESLLTRVLELAALAPDAFVDASKDPEVESLGRSLPTRLANLVTARSEKCRGLVK